MQSAIFDLDGTLSDSREGIFNAINHALAAEGYPLANPARLCHMIGPSLSQVFGDLLHTRDAELVARATERFRQYYRDQGFRENKVYAGVPRMLAQVRQAGCRLFVATTKGSETARRILSHFGLDDFFEGIFGCGVNRTKQELLREMIQSQAINPRQAAMIGDRQFDMAAAKASHLRAVGVLWGFGSRDELERSGADLLVATPDQLAPALQSE
jgi:phosphoglycolate phosphatase